MEAAAESARRRWSRRAVLAGAAGLLLPLAAEACRVFLGNNLHTVVPGRAYRCAQLHGPALERLLRERGIRTVINLRGCGAPEPWYLDECRATSRLGVSQEDISLSAGRFPPVPEVRRLVEVLDRTTYPVLFHCRQGADRTGLAAAVLRLLEPNGTLAAARQQMSARYGHVAVGRPANLDRFLDLYEAWLGKHGREHSPAAFREWLAGDDCPGEGRGKLEVVAIPAPVPPDRPSAVRVRAHNTSDFAWQFRAGANTGVHLCYFIEDPAGRLVWVGRAGLFDAQVTPGRWLDLTLTIPVLHQPGRYVMRMDLIDEAHCLFSQVNSEMLEQEIVVAGQKKE